MYTGKGFEVSELGDVDIFKHNELFHLFHLVLPNHDYIAHGVSKDGFLWRRVKNPLFIGEPGDWDDDMIWTMHVSSDPDGPSAFRMFYTGLSRKEGGRIQRIGLARSNDLYHWEKVSSANYPISIKAPYYEETIKEGRHWVSCRDPFFYKENEKRYLLVNARVPTGPLIRRGCIGIAVETTPDQFTWEKPLYHPGMYDDIEVPGLYKIEGTYYLLGNIKEDVKVHYWYCKELLGEYESFASNVLLPKGNYAARITSVDNRHLVWNFYSSRKKDNPVTILPPPTELKVAEDGQLYLTSYWRFSDKVKKIFSDKDFFPLQKVLQNKSASIMPQNKTVFLESKSGYEIFKFKPSVTDFRLSFKIAVKGLGKTGVMFRADSEASGQYISLDLINGLAQGRIWGERANASIENAFIYETIQRNKIEKSNEPFRLIEVIAFGGYIELSVDKKIVLRYVNTDYMENGILGIYVESAKIELKDFKLEELDGPEEEDHQII
ncbi:MAG: hypothetical protein JEY99_08565 [Spirochaetales bacterium]|nr:hypothetical protein [Spirochaetales bacterium]